MDGCILCYGDSNTYGYDPTDFFGGPYPEAQRWPTILARLTGCRVVNAGENGREIPHTERDVLAALELFKRQEPQLLIVMLGTNDLFHLEEQGAEAAARRMDLFLDRVRHVLPALPILLLSPPRIELPLEALQESFRALAPLYRITAARHGALFADAAPWALPLGADGVHLSELAHAALAEGVYKFLREAGKLKEN